MPPTIDDDATHLCELQIGVESPVFQRRIVTIVMPVLENADYSASAIYCISFLILTCPRRGLLCARVNTIRLIFRANYFRLNRLANLRILTVLVAAIIGDLPGSYSRSH
jgi:hypothetical protein